MKRVFALASITALAGMAAAAGCTSTGLLAPDGAHPDAMPDVRSERTSAPGPEEEGGLDPYRPKPCASMDGTKYPYTRALNAAGSCTSDELKAISSFFKARTDADEEVSVAEWSKEVSPTCAACAFGAEDAEEWPPILVKADKLDDVNRGGCIEIVSGKEDCGRAYQQATKCRLEACLKCPWTQNEFTKCLEGDAAWAGPCKTAYETLATTCGDDLAAYETACRGTAWTFEGPIEVQCITGGDAGDGGG